MEIQKTLKKAIEMIEDNLTNHDLCIGFVAKRMYISPFYFQRLFFRMAKKSLGTYIRERRLTEAGRDIKNGEPILDVAYKYGYESQESFSRAFKNFHGVSPSIAKRGGIISCCPPINVDYIKKGDLHMDFTIEKENEFEIAILVEEFDIETSNTDIPKFWDRYYEAAYQNDVPPMLGVCLPDGDGTAGNGTFHYGIGSLKDYCKTIPEGFQTFTVPKATWGKFYTKGAMPDAIQNLWQQVYQWVAQSQYEICHGYDFECYSEGDASSDDYISGIWVALKEK